MIKNRGEFCWKDVRRGRISPEWNELNYAGGQFFVSGGQTGVVQ